MNDGILIYTGMMEHDKEKTFKTGLQLSSDMEGNFLLDELTGDGNSVGLFFGPTGGNVHYVAKRIKQLMNGHEVHLHDISKVNIKQLLDYRNLIFVSSTLGNEIWEVESQDKWAAFLPKMRRISLAGKNVGIVGLGDSVLYPNHFVDSMKTIADCVRDCGGLLVGLMSTDGYTYQTSKAIEDELFLGLPLDNDNEPEKTDDRITHWISLLAFDR